MRVRAGVVAAFFVLMIPPADLARAETVTGRLSSRIRMSEFNPASPDLESSTSAPVTAS